MVDKRADRYSRLFDADRWHVGADDPTSNDDLKDAFADWVFGQRGKPLGTVHGFRAWQRLWQEPRLAELFELLRFDDRPPNRKTAPMLEPDLDRTQAAVETGEPLFRDRPVLPPATDIRRGNSAERAVRAALGGDLAGAGEWEIGWIEAGGRRAAILARTTAAFTPAVQTAIQAALKLDELLVVQWHRSLRDTITAGFTGAVPAGMALHVRPPQGTRVTISVTGPEALTQAERNQLEARAGLLRSVTRVTIRM
jgi:hypothetical protein